MEEYNFSCSEEADNKDIKEIFDELISFNTDKAGDPKRKIVTITIKDLNSKVVGGLHGYISWNLFSILYVWIDDSLRGKGFGKNLMERAEKEALSRGCKHILLDTFTFQAPEFYKKMGFQEFARLKNFPPGHSKVFLYKDIG